ncbi:MAG: glycosyltransferase family 4 protein [Patescibacteria group bacterium]
MKIAFLNIYNGLVDRGAETFVKEVAQRLSEKHNVTVFQGGSKQDFEKYKVETINPKFNWKKKDQGFTLKRRFFIDYWSIKIFLFTLKATPKILKEKFDIVIPVNGGWMPAVLRIATWLYRGKLVITGQSGIGWDDLNNLWCFPNVFVALSEYASHWCKGMNNFVKVKVIPNGVDVNRFKASGEVYKTNLKKPIILCVGALTKQKRIELAIKAVSKIKDTSLLVCGDGVLKNKITKLGRNLLGDRFKLINVPFEKISSVYRSADLFTLPSEDYQAFEIVLIEAMATNIPVVANNDPIREEIVGDGGLLVNPLNIQKYSESLKEALRKDWSDKPFNQAKKFDWDIISQKYEELFNTLIKK